MVNYKYGKRSKVMLYGDESRPGVHEVVVKLCLLALEYSTVDFGITDGHRTSEQQQKMYATGKSELDGVKKISDHQRGLAIDVYPSARDANGKRLNMYKVNKPGVRKVWLEVYRAFMRAAMKLGLVLEFGLGYNIGGGRDWPHVSIKGRVPKDYSGMSLAE